MKSLALALFAVLLLTVATAAGATCWIDCYGFYCKKPTPTPTPVPYAETLATPLAAPGPSTTIDCCVCCSPPGGPVTCEPLRGGESAAQGDLFFDLEPKPSMSVHPALARPSCGASAEL